MLLDHGLQNNAFYHLRNLTILVIYHCRTLSKIWGKVKLLQKGGLYTCIMAKSHDYNISEFRTSKILFSLYFSRNTKCVYVCVRVRGKKESQINAYIPGVCSLWFANSKTDHVLKIVHGCEEMSQTDWVLAASPSLWCSRSISPSLDFC